MSRLRLPHLAVVLCALGAPIRAQAQPVDPADPGAEVGPVVDPVDPGAEVDPADPADPGVEVGPVVEPGEPVDGPAEPVQPLGHEDPTLLEPDADLVLRRPADASRRAISLRDTVGRSVTTNRDLRTARASISEARARAAGVDAASLYPWMLDARVTYTHQDRPVRDAFAEGVQISDTFNWSVGVTRRWPFGLDLSVAITNVTTRNETPLAFQVEGGAIVRDRRVVGPFHSALLQLDATYHLLAGGDEEANLIAATQADRQVDIARLELARSASDALLEVTQTYWDLWLAEAELVVRSATLDSVRHQREVTAALVEGGVTARIELDLVDEQLLGAEEGILLAAAQRDQHALHLAQLLADADPRPLSARDRLTLPPLDADAVDALVEQAIASAPSVRVLEAQRELQRLEITRAEAATDYTLDLVLTLQQQGIDDDLSLSQDFWYDAYAQVVLLRAGAITAGVVFSMPLDNRQAESQVDVARVALDRVESELDAARALIAEQVRVALSQVQSARRRLDLLERLIARSQQNLDAAEERFQAGLITVLDLQQLRDQLLERRLQALSVRVQLAQQTLLIHHLTGQLTDRLGVTLAED